MTEYQNLPIQYSAFMHKEPYIDEPQNEDNDLNQKQQNFQQAEHQQQNEEPTLQKQSQIVQKQQENDSQDTSQKQEQITSSQNVKQQNEKQIQNINTNSPDSKVESTPVYTLRQRIDDANAMKNKGNDQFKVKNYIPSIDYYREGLKILDREAFINANPQIMQQGRDLSYVFLSNISLAHLKLENFKQSVVYSNQVLRYNPKHQKSLFRRASAYFCLKDYDKAFKDIEQYLKINQLDRESIELKKKIVAAQRTQQRQRDKQQKQMFQNMFRPKSQKSQSSVDLSNKPGYISQKERSNTPFMNVILCGILGVSVGCYLTKQTGVLNSLEKTISITGTCLSASLLGTSSSMFKTIGVVGIGAIASYMYFKK